MVVISQPAPISCILSPIVDMMVALHITVKFFDLKGAVGLLVFIR
jgi:hypothetical protein